MRRPGALLYPMVNVARSDHDENRIEMTVLGKHARENKIQLGRPHSRVTDVAHVHPPRTQSREGVWRIEKTLEAAGPATRLVEPETLNSAPACHQNSIEPGLAGADLGAALAVSVDIETTARLELGRDIRVHENFHSRVSGPDTVAGPMSQPPAAPELRNCEGGNNDERARHDPGGHARLHALSNGRRARRSMYGSLRYTNTAHVNATTAIIARPAPANSVRP